MEINGLCDNFSFGYSTASEWKGQFQLWEVVSFFFFSSFWYLFFKLQNSVLGKIWNDSVDFVGFNLRAIPVKKGKGKKPNLILNYCDICSTLEINLGICDPFFTEIFLRACFQWHTVVGTDTKKMKKKLNWKYIWMQWQVWVLCNSGVVYRLCARCCTGSKGAAVAAAAAVTQL